MNPVEKCLHCCTTEYYSFSLVADRKTMLSLLQNSHGEHCWDSERFVKELTNEILSSLISGKKGKKPVLCP